MTADEAAAIARRLSPGQCSTIEGLDESPALLGCAEPCARTLAQARVNRPALVVLTHDPDRTPLFALNADGLAVKAALASERG